MCSPDHQPAPPAWTAQVPLVARYDGTSTSGSPPGPAAVPAAVSGPSHRTISHGTLRKMLNTALGQHRPDRCRDGQPLNYTPHDFRRIFITDAIMNGLPPHIAQVIAGHRDINITIGYKAIYPDEAIQAHLAFLARRRGLRPSEEYRDPTDEEWEEFLGHFERRKVATGNCGRAFGTPCIHEHSCLRCSMHWPDPAQRPRLAEIRDNLTARIAEAEREGWLGEVEGLKISLAGAEDKLAQIDRRSHATVHLGIPAASPPADRSGTRSFAATKIKFREWSSAPSWPTCSAPSSPGSAASRTPFPWWWPTTTTSASGTRRCRCCSSGACAQRTGPSPPRPSASCSTSPWPPPGSPTPPPAAPVRAPRFPQDAHHRRDHARHAAAHRPARRRPPRHQHHHGIQGRLPRRGHQRPPGIHRPPPGPAPQPGIPHPHRRRMGGVPRPFRAPPGRARRLRPRLRDQLHPRAQLHPLFPPAARPSPAARLAGIRDNLRDRITEAQQHHWAGEAEGLKVSLAAATAKLAQMDELAARQATAVDLGMPAFTQTASRTTTAPAILPVSQQTWP